MGLEDRYENKKSGENAGSSSADMNNKNDEDELRTSMSEPSFLTFDGGFGLDLANAATSIGAKMNELFATSKNKFGVKVFDKEKYESQYSFITISTPNAVGDTVFYYTLLLAETGPEPLTAEQFIERVNSVDNQEEGVAGLYTLDAMLDLRTIEIVESVLLEDYPKVELVEIGSSVVDGPIQNKLIEVLNHVVKHLAAADALEMGNDLNLPYALEKEGNGSRPAELKANYRYIPDGVFINGLGNTVKAEFEIKLTKVSRVSGFNVSNSTRELTTVYGYIDFTVEEVADRHNNVTNFVNKFIPHIIVTNMVLNKYTTNFALLATVTAAIMSNKEMLVGHILKNRDDLAAAIAVVSVGDKKASKAIEDLIKCSDEEFVAILNEQMSMEPILSIDIDNNGANEFLAPFVNCAITGNKAKLLDAAAILSDRSEIANSNILPFANMTKLPRLQYYQNGDRDGRDFTFQRVVARSKDITKAFEYNAVITSPNAIVDCVEILSEFIPDADVKGTLLRLTIHPEFLSTLYNALSIDNITYNALYVPSLRERKFGGNTGEMRIRGGYFKPASGNSRARMNYDTYGRSRR